MGVVAGKPETPLYASEIEDICDSVESDSINFQKESVTDDIPANFSVKTMSEINSKNEQNKILAVSNSVKTLPPKETKINKVPKNNIKSEIIVQKTTKTSTGTSPPPQSIATQVSDGIEHDYNILCIVCIIYCNFPKKDIILFCSLINK